MGRSISSSSSPAISCRGTTVPDTFRAWIPSLATCFPSACACAGAGHRGGKPEITYWRDGEIVLAPELFEEDGPVIRDCCTHALSHCLTGGCCRRARLRQERQYGELLDLP